MAASRLPMLAERMSPFQAILEILNGIRKEVSDQYQSREKSAAYQLLHFYISFFEDAEKAGNLILRQSHGFPNIVMMNYLTQLGIKTEHYEHIANRMGDSSCELAAFCAEAAVQYHRVIEEPIAETLQPLDRITLITLNDANDASNMQILCMDSCFQRGGKAHRMVQAFLIMQTLCEAANNLDLNCVANDIKQRLALVNTDILLKMNQIVMMGIHTAVEMLGIGIEDAEAQMCYSLVQVATTIPHCDELRVETIKLRALANLEEFIKPIKGLIKSNEGLHSDQDGIREKIDTEEATVHIDGVAEPKDGICKGSTTNLYQQAKLKLCEELKSIYMSEEAKERQAEILNDLANIYYREALGNDISEYYIFASGLLNAALVRTKQSSLQEELMGTIVDIHKDFLCKVCKLTPESHDCQRWKEETEKNKSRMGDVRKIVHKKCRELSFMIDDYRLTPDMGDLMAKENIIIDQTSTVFKGISNQVKTFVKDMISDCESVLGPPPCRYAMIGLGSLAREEATPYSDLEFAILIEEDHPPSSKTYFWNLVQYLHLKVIDLGETILPSLSIPCLNDFYSEDVSKRWFYDVFTPSGFKFDGNMPWACKTPIGRKRTASKPAQDLILTPSQMAALQNMPSYHTGDYHLSDVLYCTSLITGEVELYDEYNRTLHTSDDKPCSFKRLHYWVRGQRAFAQYSLIDYFRHNNFGKSPLGMASPIKVKSEMYRMTSLLLTDMRIMMSSQLHSTWEFLDHLRMCVRENSFNLHHQLTMLLVLVHMIRLLTYDAKGCQDEFLTFASEELSAFHKHIPSPMDVKCIANFHIKVRLTTLMKLIPKDLLDCLSSPFKTGIPWPTAYKVWVSQEWLYEPSYGLDSIDIDFSDAILVQHVRAMVAFGLWHVSPTNLRSHCHYFYKRYKDTCARMATVPYTLQLATLLLMASAMKCCLNIYNDNFTEEVCKTAMFEFRKYATEHGLDVENVTALNSFSGLCVVTNDYSDVTSHWRSLKDALKRPPNTSDRETSRALCAFNEDDIIIAIELIDITVDMLYYKQSVKSQEIVERKFVEDMVSRLAACSSHSSHMFTTLLTEFHKDLLHTLQYVCENPDSLKEFADQYLVSHFSLPQTLKIFLPDLERFAQSKQWDKAAALMNISLELIVYTIAGRRVFFMPCDWMRESHELFAALTELNSAYPTDYSDVPVPCESELLFKNSVLLSTEAYELLGDGLMEKGIHSLALHMHKRSIWRQIGSRLNDCESMKRKITKFTACLFRLRPVCDALVPCNL